MSLSRSVFFLLLSGQRCNVRFVFFVVGRRWRLKTRSLIFRIVLSFAYTSRARIPLNSKCDLWSVGVVAYMLLSSCVPFSGRDMREVASAILRSEFGFVGERWREVSEHGKGFVASLLERDAPSRPTADDAIRHPWLTRSLSSPSAASKKKTNVNGRGIGNDGNSNRLLYRRNSSASFGGAALLPSSMHGPPRDSPSPGKLALECQILDSIENYSTYSWMVS